MVHLDFFFDMDNAVFETLLRVADSDGTIRTAAENRLKELAIEPGKSAHEFDFKNTPFIEIRIM